MSDTYEMDSKDWNAFQVAFKKNRDKKELERILRVVTLDYLTDPTVTQLIDVIFDDMCDSLDEENALYTEENAFAVSLFYYYWKTFEDFDGKATLD